MPHSTETTARDSLNRATLYVTAQVVVMALVILAYWLGMDANLITVALVPVMLEMIRQLQGVKHNLNSVMDGLDQKVVDAQAETAVLEREKHDRQMTDAFVAATHDRIDDTADAAVDEAVIETAQKADKAVDAVIETASKKADAAVDAAIKKVKGEPDNV